VRPLEITSTLSVIASIFILVSGRFERPWFVAVAVLASFLIGCHGMIEGMRWQMLPIYFAGAMFLLYSGVQLVSGDKSIAPSGLEYPAGMGAMLFVGIGIVLSTALPVFELPAPTGPYKIGTQVRHIVDLKRRDPFGSEETKSRELMIQIWYPVDVTIKGALFHYRGRDETTIWNARYSLAKTHAIDEAPVSGQHDSYPVVIFAPSWWGGRSEATFQAEELASHGYMVVGMDHPYSTLLTVFPDRRMVSTKLIVSEDYSSDAGFQAFITAADEQVRIRAEDARSVLDVLEIINADDPDHRLTGRLDMNRVGILGYSIGGGTAAQACWLDNRFRAGVDLDGMVAAESESQGTRTPFFFIFGGFPPSPEDVSIASGSAKREAEFDVRQFNQVTRSLSETGGYLMILPGQSHASFSDRPFYSPLNSITYPGAISAERAARMLSKYVIAFFDRQFGKPVDDALFRAPAEISNASLKLFDVRK
jgi:predicted dienelactone hydrolase